MTVSERRPAVGWLFLVGGTLLFGALLSITLLGSPPSEPSSITSWVHDHSFPLMLSNELLFFAAVSLASATVALWPLARTWHPTSSVIACVGLMMAAFTLLLLLFIEGRLVYPVAAIALSAEVVAFTVSLFYGVLHTALLLFGLALIALAVAMRRTSSPRWLQVASYAAGALQIVGSFPWFTPTWFNAVVAIVLWAWMLALGLWLVTTPNTHIVEK